MFALNVDELIKVINSKRKEDLTIRALLYAMVPNPLFGYPELSTGEFETESEYNNLSWDDERVKPTWAELQAIRQSAFDQERALDLEQLRQMRYVESSIEHDGDLYNVNPNMVVLVESQLKYAELTQSPTIGIPMANKQVKLLTTAAAENLLLIMRSKLNQWIIDPRVP